MTCACIKTIRLIRYPKPIRCQRSAIDGAIVAIAALIIRIAIEWPPADEAVGGDVGGDLG